MKFMSDNSLAELVTKIKDGFLPVKSITAIRNADNANLNNYVTTGIFVIGGMGADTVPGNLRIGYLIVIAYSSTSVAQFWIEKNIDSTYLDYPIFCRHFENSSWSNWVRLPSKEDLSGKVNTTDFTLSNITGTLSVEKGGTGATNKYNAITNLAYNIVSSGPPYTKDLNYYTAQTISCFTSVAATSHIPTGSSGNGMLIVITPDRTDLYQIWIEMSSGAADTYIRTSINGTWSNWDKIINASDFTLANITGTLPVSKGGTGATDKFNAVANLAYNIIEAGSPSYALNLNAYAGQTINYFSSSVPATSNIPTGSSGIGMLAVITPDGGDIYQMWLELSGSTADTYVRTKTNSTWNNWGKVYTTNDDLPVVNHIRNGIGATDVSTTAIFKRAGVNYITGYIITAPTSTTAVSANVGYIPEAYRGSETHCTAYNATENTFHTCTIQTGGRILIDNVVKTANATQNFYISAQWI